MEHDQALVQAIRDLLCCEGPIKYYERRTGQATGSSTPGTPNVRLPEEIIPRYYVASHKLNTPHLLEVP